jgi:hypothetical protein
MKTGSARIIGLVAASAVFLVGCLDLDDDDTTRDDTGSIVEGGDIGAFSIQIGDCIGADVGVEVESVQGVPCDSPHQYEVYHRFEIASEDSVYPGQSVIDTEAEQGCLAAFEGFVGLSYEASIYDFATLTPTVESWDELDDREVLCMIGNLDGTPKTGTAQNTAI